MRPNMSEMLLLRILDDHYWGGLLDVAFRMCKKDLCCGPLV